MSALERILRWLFDIFRPLLFDELKAHELAHLFRHLCRRATDHVVTDVAAIGAMRDVPTGATDPPVAVVATTAKRALSKLELSRAMLAMPRRRRVPT